MPGLLSEAEQVLRASALPISKRFGFLLEDYECLLESSAKMQACFDFDAHLPKWRVFAAPQHHFAAHDRFFCFFYGQSWV